MNTRNIITSGFLFIGLLHSGSIPLDKSNKFLYKDPKISIEKRVNNLLKQMTIKEKIGQMTQLSHRTVHLKKAGSRKAQFKVDFKKAEQKILVEKVGSFLIADGFTPDQLVTFLYELQKIATEKSRLSIPLIVGIDNIHGTSYVKGGTIFPQANALANSFNPELAFEMAKVTVLETSHLGTHWNFAPLLDLMQEPYWSRAYETFGEDPYLTSKMGVGYVKGIEAGNKLVTTRLTATAKHFLGYSVPRRGFDREEAYINPQYLQEFHRPAFQAVFDAGLETVMVNSGSINGVPVHASKAILTDLLRKQMKFKGVVLTDSSDIIYLYSKHGFAKNNLEAIALAIKAGIDMSMVPRSDSFGRDLFTLVKEGVISEERINASVERIIRLKFKLGLFENPYPNKKFHYRIGTKKNKLKALEAAHQSIVLLKNNDSLLPINDKPAQTILVTGISANSKKNLCGGWTIKWQGAPDRLFSSNMHTVYTAIKDRFKQSKVRLLDKPKVDTKLEQQKFLKAVKQANYVIIASGDEPYAEGDGNTYDLELTKEQQTTIRLASSVNKNCILLLIEGRPNTYGYIIRDGLEPRSVLFAGLPGEYGADAIADIIRGRINPSGKLSFSYPSHAGSYLPYNVKKKQKKEDFILVHKNIKKRFYHKAIAYSFGHGLSYTDFNYSNLTLEKNDIKKNEIIKGTVNVKNIGKREGKESVLFFISDKVSNFYKRPFKKLFYFQKIFLKPNESKTIEFTINPIKDLSFPDEKGNLILEKGAFTIKVGKQSKGFNLL